LSTTNCILQTNNAEKRPYKYNLKGFIHTTQRSNPRASPGGEEGGVQRKKTEKVAKNADK